MEWRGQGWLWFSEVVPCKSSNSLTLGGCKNIKDSWDLYIWAWHSYMGFPDLGTIISALLPAPVLQIFLQSGDHCPLEFTLPYLYLQYSWYLAIAANSSDPSSPMMVLYCGFTRCDSPTLAIGFFSSDWNLLPQYAHWCCWECAALFYVLFWVLFRVRLRLLSSCWVTGAVESKHADR